MGLLQSMGLYTPDSMVCIKQFRMLSLNWLNIAGESTIYQVCMIILLGTVDWEIFTLKIIRMRNFHVKFSRSHLIREIFVTVDNCNMDERLESSWHLAYYQVSGEPGIARCSRRSDI